MDELNEKITPEEENNTTPEPTANQDDAPELVPTSDNASEDINIDELFETIIADAPAEEEAPDLGPLPEEEPKTVWSFSEQAKKDRETARESGRKGAFVYAIVMTGLFAVCFAVLAILLITGFGSGADRTVVVGPDASVADLVDSVKDSVVTVEVKTARSSSTCLHITLRVLHLIIQSDVREEVENLVSLIVCHLQVLGNLLG